MSGSARRAERRQRLLEAGLELFGTQGIAATTIADVCAEAGLTKRYFYESFATIDELAEALFDSVTADLIDRVAAAIAATAGEDPRPALTVYTRAVLGDVRLARFLGVESRTGALAKRHAGFADRAVGLWFGSAGGDHGRPVEPAVRLRAYGFAGALAEVMLAWGEGRIELTVEAVTEELVELFQRIEGRR